MSSSRPATIPVTPLDTRIAELTGDSGRLTRAGLERLQMDRLRTILDHAASKSPFYAEHLRGCPPENLHTPADLARLPFLDETALRNHGDHMICGGQDETARVMTRHSSGTTGPPKRLCFSEPDLEATMDFFHHGMTTFTRPGDTVLIMLPGTTPDGTGDLLRRALERFGARGIVHGLMTDPRSGLEALVKEKPHVIVAFPIHAVALAEYAASHNVHPHISALLLCSDYIPKSVVSKIDRIWGCPSFSHWGTVETGLGGGVECAALDGCHIREADLLAEIVDPETGSQLSDGEWGELVITTLNRRLMPLIRYRTGDLARFLPAPCACGSVLKRLDKVQGRIGSRLNLDPHPPLGMNDLDEALLGIPGLVDFRAELENTSEGRVLHIRAAALIPEPNPNSKNGLAEIAAAAHSALSALPWFNAERQLKGCPPFIMDFQASLWHETGLNPAKRTIATK